MWSIYICTEMLVCVCVSEQTKCGTSRSGQRRACDKEDITGTHFILQTTKLKKRSDQKVTDSGQDTSPARQFSASRQPCRINNGSSWEPSSLPAGGSDYTPESIKEAIKSRKNMLGKRGSESPSTWGKQSGRQSPSDIVRFP